MNLKLVGIGGTNGAGKDTVGHMLAAEYNLLFVSVSDLLREEARKRKLPVTREVLRTISAEWRRDYGLGVLVDKAIEHFKSLDDKYDGVIACPMRNVGEAQHVKDLGGIVVWVDAEPQLRYERIQSASRGREGEDDKTYEQFLAEQEAEMHPPEGSDDAVLNIAGVKQIADIFIDNNDNSFDDLKATLDAHLKL